MLSDSGNRPDTPDYDDILLQNYLIVQYVILYFLQLSYNTSCNVKKLSQQ